MSIRRASKAFCVAVVAALALPCAAEPSAASTSRPTSAPADKVAKLIEQLGDKRSEVSEAGRKELVALSNGALESLTNALYDADGEQAGRILAVREEIFKARSPAPFYQGIKIGHDGAALPDGRFVNGNDDIFENAEARRLYEEAKTFDPMFTREKVDREKAVKLYMAAMEAQPWAAMNGPIAERIAQLYAFYENKDLGYRPDFKVAAVWWVKCIDATSSSQLLWAQAYMGAGCTGVIERRRMDAAGCFQQILSVDMSKIEPPRWKFRSSQKQYYADVDLAKKRIEELKVLAVEKIHYTVRADKQKAAQAMRKISEDYKDTPAGNKAAQILAEIEKK